MVEYTMSNLESFICAHRDIGNPEPIVTQWLNTLTGLLVYTTDAVLDPNKLKRIAIGDARYDSLGFPGLKFLHHDPPYERHFSNLGQLIRALRNGLAHGSFVLLPGTWLLNSNQVFAEVGGELAEPIEKPVDASFIGVVVVVKLPGDNGMAPMILDYHDLKAFVTGLASTSRDQSLWRYGSYGSEIRIA